jgi:hypothetical protein
MAAVPAAVIRAVFGEMGQDRCSPAPTSSPAPSWTRDSASAGPDSRTRCGSASGRSVSRAQSERLPRLTGAVVPGKECGPRG